MKAARTLFLLQSVLFFFFEAISPSIIASANVLSSLLSISPAMADLHILCDPITDAVLIKVASCVVEH